MINLTFSLSTGIGIFFAVAAMVQSLLASSILLTQKRRAMIVVPMFTFFLLNAITYPSYILENISNFDSMVLFLNALLIPIDVLMPALLWFYVCGITEKLPSKSELRYWPHLVLFGIGVFLFISLQLLDYQARFSVLNDLEGKTLIQCCLAYVYSGISIAVPIQAIIYLVIISRRLAVHQKKLRDIYSSTKNHELTWVLYLALLFSLDWCFSLGNGLVERVLKREVDFSPYDDGLDFFLYWFFMLWALRQKTMKISGLDEGSLQKLSSKKYQRSGLSLQRQRNIAQKIEAKMNSECLYSNSDLTLMDLSKSINELPNYVSQTLNSEFGETFHSYINRLRVDETKLKLENSNEPISVIAYSAGFNSRSSFYRAFKKLNGITPSQYKKQLNL